MKTIKERGYAHWEGDLVQKKWPWWPITRNGIRLIFRKRFFKPIFILALIPAVVFLVGIYLSERLDDFRFMLEGNSQILYVNATLFKTYLSNDFLLFMIVVILVFAGAGQIADDLRFNSLQLYFSRPLKKQDYLLGKASVLFFFIFCLTLAPGFFLFLMKLIFSGGLKFFFDYPVLPLSITGYSVLLMLFFSSYTLLLSSISKNKRYVIILIVGIYFFTEILFAIFFEIFKNPYLSLLSIKANLQQLGAAFFGVKASYDVPWPLSLSVVIGVCCLSAIVLLRKVRSVEIAK